MKSDISINKCEYASDMPINGQYICFAYSKAKIPDNKPYKKWAHYPFCNDNNCPLKHPKLLEGASLIKD